MTRDERQQLSLERWLQTGHRGTLECTTGFGKTRVAVNAISLLRRNDRSRSVIVIVPTLQLQTQWIDVLEQNGQRQSTSVLVINSAVRLNTLRCDMLILDEIHRYAAETFYSVFNVIRYDFILGLTATMKRLDAKHTFLMEKCPIVDTVTLQDARRNGWVSEFREYNLGVEMADEERERYNKLEERFQSIFDMFNNDFDLLKQCAATLLPPRSESGSHYQPRVVRLAISRGWSGNTAETAARNVIRNRTAPAGSKVSIWGNRDHHQSPDKLHGFAIAGMNIMQAIKKAIHASPTKLETAIAIMDRFDVKTISFGELVETADQIKERLGDRCVVYHSKVKAAIIDGKKVAGAKLKRDAISKISTDDSVRVIATAKALDQGFDYPGAELGIIISRTSSPTQYTQRVGRVVRKHVFEDGTEKKGMIVNIFLKGTRDAKWLEKSQKGKPGIYETEDIEELFIPGEVNEPVGVNQNV